MISKGIQHMISIIIPAHNEEENLKTLLPLLNGMDQDLITDIIVALSCTNCDGSENLGAEGKVTFLKCEGKGRALQMNRAAARANGSVLVFLHADVIPPISFLHDVRTTIENGYQAGFFSYRFDTESVLLKLNAKFTAKDGVFTGGGDQCLFIQKEVFNELGGFDENQVLMEDFELFERMKKKGVRYKIVKNDLIVSARKYRYNSYVRVNLVNLLLVVLFKCGYPPKKLKALHYKLLRTSCP